MLKHERTMPHPKTNPAIDAELPPITLVDSHCHLNYPEIFPHIDAVLANATAHDIRYCLTINTRLSETTTIKKIAETYPHVFCTVGVHPHDAKDHDVSYLFDELAHHATHPKVVGLGETGLDYYYNNSPRDEQIACFDIHLAASKQFNLPVIVHTRDADADTLALVKQHPDATGVFHCFSGGLDLAKAVLDRGYYVSFSGIITFKKAEELREVVKFTPIDRMLIETDSPFLAPIPHRGQPNQPAWTRLVAEKVAEIKGMPLVDVAKATTANFFQLFHKAKAI
jgi:TatD DNase family protein